MVIIPSSKAYEPTKELEQIDDSKEDDPNLVENEEQNVGGIENADVANANMDLN